MSKFKFTSGCKVILFNHSCSCLLSKTDPSNVMALYSSIVTAPTDIKSGILHFTVIQNDVDSVRVYLILGANPNLIFQGECSPLLRATMEDYMEIVKLLLEDGADPESMPPYDHATFLLLASKNGSTDIVSLLLERGANINHRGLDGKSAYTLALEYHHYETAQYLMDNGAYIELD